MAKAAVIFDVDGVLLNLTAAEENLFFEPFERRYGLTGLSRDWNSYRIRNDEQIVAEIFERYSLPETERPSLTDEYHALLASRLANGTLQPQRVPGAADLLKALNDRVRLGIATANFRQAAHLRLKAAGLWEPVRNHARGADGSGHKWQTLAGLVAELELPPNRIVYVGDNVNDVEAGLRTGVHFIGFSEVEGRATTLKQAGASHTCHSHNDTLRLIKEFLRLD